MNLASPYVVALQKSQLTYHTYVAPTFLAHALSDFARFTSKVKHG